MNGVIDGMPEVEYHAHPALSVSGAKKLLPPSCPALFKYERDHGQPHKAVFDFGHAAHATVLGVGAPLAIVFHDSYRTKAAQAERDEAYAAGAVPLLEEEFYRVQGMAQALKAHPIAAALLNPDHGKPEQSLFWHDLKHGVTRRGRLDWLPNPSDDRLIVTDYKTCASAEPGAISRAVANFGYAMQAAWYIDLCRALELADDVAFVFIFQEKTAPYLITVCELDAEALRIGRAKNGRALEVFADCTATDTWPAYSSDVELISLPRWATYTEDAA